jgi:uncharacterized protein (DUF885 family)
MIRQKKLRLSISQEMVNMRFHCYFTTILMITAVFLAEASPMTESQKLKTFFEEEWEYGLKENPIFASYIGDFRYNDQIGDFSLESIKRQQQHQVDALKRLQSIDRSQLQVADQLNYDLYLDSLKLDIEGHAFPEYLMPVTPRGGIQIQAPAIVDSLPFRNMKDYQDFLSRLKLMPGVFDQIINLMKDGLAQKITPAKVTLAEVESQIKSQIVQNPEDSPFYKPFKKFPENIPTTEQERLRAEAKQAISNGIAPAYQKLLNFWTKEYYPATRESIALSELPNGKAWYAYMAKRMTTTDLTPEQIHEIGVKEVTRIRAEMDKVIKQTGFKGSFEEFIQFLRTDSQFYYTKPEDLLTAYRDICKRIDAQLPKLFGKLPRTPYGVKEVPEYSAPSSTTAYYEPGSMEAGRPGWYYANTYKLESRPKWEMEALSIHEAVPGHHLQISLAQEMENVPQFRKFGNYTAFIEGWGLYSESLGSEMGFYTDLYSKFGQLTYEMWRAIRLVVDTGMHVFGWDRQKAIDYFKANSSKPEHDIIVEIDRYINSPAQALAYKIGELKIKELRKYSNDQLGGRFDIREFHDHVLGSGAVPLSLLDAQIKEYVASKKTK